MLLELLQDFEETLQANKINGFDAIASFWGDFAVSVISMVSELLQDFEENLQANKINGFDAIASFWGKTAS